MKCVKKLLVAVFFTFVGLTAFAQVKTTPVSQTNAATNGLFFTDVDKFMDVNEWDTVNPQNGFFVFTIDANGYDMGYAKQLKKFFWGTYFNGAFGNYTKRETEQNDTKTTDITEGSTANPTNFIFSNLFGFGNKGVKVDFYYSTTGSTKNDNGTSVTSTDKTKWSLYSTLGWKNAVIKGRQVVPAVWLYFDYNYSDGQQQTNNSTVASDSRDWRLALGAGGTTVLKTTEIRKSSLTALLQFDIVQPVDKDLLKQKAYSFELPVEYECIFTPAEKFTFGFKSGLKNTLAIVKDTRLNNGQFADGTTYTLTPSFKAGFKYDTLKKFILNAGVELALPEFTLTSAKNLTTKVEVTQYEWDGNDGKVGFTSGFQFVPAKNLIFDCNWAILASVFGTDMRSDLVGTDIWQTINEILIHNITIQISYKF